MERKQTNRILQDLNKKIVFLVGPRQVGKTWLAKKIAESFDNSVYLNYDHLEDRELIYKEAWLESTELLILDELHKMPNWKNYIKGVYDTKLKHLKILVTGSARLNAFRQVGDSLAGRFFLSRLLPFSPAELINTKYSTNLDRFLERGSFPEPFLADSSQDADRWRMHYIDSLLRDDIFEFDKVADIKAIRLVFELLRSKVGSPISCKSIAEDVGVSPHTVKKYIQIFEELYIIFRITPYSKNIARSLLKEPKIYFFDVGLVKGDIGAKLENLVAVCFLKHCYAKEDYEGKAFPLHYLRTKDGREVDFALVQEDNVKQLIEVKYKEKNIDPNLVWFHNKYALPSVQIVKELQQGRINRGIEVKKMINYLQNLYM